MKKLNYYLSIPFCTLALLLSSCGAEQNSGTQDTEERAVQEEVSEEVKAIESKTDELEAEMDDLESEVNDILNDL